MKIYRDLERIENRDKWGKRFSFTGLAILFVGLIASFIPTWYPPEVPGQTELIRFLQANWTTISFIALPLGFICANIGSYNINRFARRRWPGNKQMARPDEVLQRALKGIDNKYAYHAFSLPANYVVAGPCGLLVFLAKSDKGRVNAKGDRWREPFSLGRMMTVFAREGIGRPQRDLELQQEDLRKFLAQIDAEAGAVEEHDAELSEEQKPSEEQKAEKKPIALANTPIDGAVVFLNGGMQLELENPIPAGLRADQVKQLIRRKTKEVKLSNAHVRELIDALEEYCTDSDGAEITE